MKPINNYIVERIKIDNIKHQEFPIDGKIDDIVDFLQNQGFSRIQPNTTINLRSQFNIAETKCFVVERTTIWFADTSKNNGGDHSPVFSIECLSQKQGWYYIWGYNSMNAVDKEEFLEAINKQFDF